MNILVIPDLHAPFEVDRAVEFCKKVKDRYNTISTVFLGDVLDNHASSFHDSDPDGMGAGMELRSARVHLQKWHDAFPYATVTLGNHDNIFSRKIYKGGLSREVMKPLHEILNVPGWEFVPFYEFKGWHFSHGMGQLVHTRAKDLGMNCIAGHVHSKFEARFNGKHWSIFAGCLVDSKSYAMAYGKYGKQQQLGCVVILNVGEDNEMVKMIRYDDVMKEEI